MAKVFLSFRGEDLRKVWTLRGLAEFKNVDFEMDDVSLRDSVNSTDKSYIRSVIRPKIKDCGVCVCLIGENTWRSRIWVPWEVELAREEGKPILAMRFWDTPKAITPKILDDLNVTPFDWDVAKLFQKVRYY